MKFIIFTGILFILACYYLGYKYPLTFLPIFLTGVIYFLFFEKK